MSKVIWKFELETTDEQVVLMPFNSEILTVQTQTGKPCLWALVNPELEKEARVIETFGTGHPIPDGKRTYIGTYQLLGGKLIFHVFESQEH